MHSFEKTRIIPCPARRMFEVVMDIDAYQEFLPWVAESRVLTRREGELTAELVAELAGARYAFKTVDRYLPGKLVEIRLLEGPFKFLESLWTFDALDADRCKVGFSIEFEFRNMMLDMVASPLFSAACKAMVDAFEKRALALRD